MKKPSPGDFCLTGDDVGAIHGVGSGGGSNKQFKRLIVGSNLGFGLNNQEPPPKAKPEGPQELAIRSTREKSNWGGGAAGYLFNLSREEEERLAKLKPKELAERRPAMNEVLQAHLAQEAAVEREIQLVEKELETHNRSVMSQLASSGRRHCRCRGIRCSRSREERGGSAGALRERALDFFGVRSVKIGTSDGHRRANL